MLVRILLVVAVLIGGYFLTRRLHRFPWRAPGSRLLVAAGVILLLLLLTVRGGAEIAVPLLAVPALFLMRWLNVRSPPSPADPAQPGSVGYSTVTTRFLSMKLNHATGAMTGQVLEGRFVGCSLRDLPLRDLLALWRECQDDSQSVAVLEAYLDHHAEANWREQAWVTDQATNSALKSSGAMDRAEAYQILGLRPEASREEIQAAYRRLIQRVHPDHGGSSYLAARLNQARDVLLGT